MDLKCLNAYVKTLQICNTFARVHHNPEQLARLAQSLMGTVLQTKHLEVSLWQIKFTHSPEVSALNKTPSEEAALEAEKYLREYGHLAFNIGSSNGLSEKVYYGHASTPAEDSSLVILLTLDEENAITLATEEGIADLLKSLSELLLFHLSKITPQVDQPLLNHELDRLNASSRESHKALLTALSPFPVLTYDKSGVIIMTNPAAKRILQLKYKQHLSDLLPGFNLDGLKNCIRDGSILSISVTLADRTFEFVARGVPGPDFGILYGMDITDRVHSEERLKHSQQFLRNVIDANPNLIFIKDAEGRFKLANQSLAQVYGTTVEGLIGKTDSDFNKDVGEVEAYRKDDLEVIHFQKELIVPEESVTDADGVTHWFKTFKKPFKTVDNKIHVLGVATDITDLKQLQEQLLQSQKMEAIGQLAGGIAHDFNNLLTGILGYTDILVMSSAGNPQINKAADSIAKAATQGGQLTQKLLGFARKGKHQHVPVDLHAVISEVLEILQRTLEKHILINTEYTADNPFIKGDPSQVQQIILNLAINARDAMTKEFGGSDGGTLSIITRSVQVDADSEHHQRGLIPGTYIEVSVSDTGCGINPAIMSKIFEPFFTTKEISRGTGMGLAMVYGIVKNHGGTIHVQSTVDQGSQFRIWLPTSLEKETHIRAGQLNQTSEIGRGNILLVDDHSMIRDVTAQMLANLGYQVVTAEDGVQALHYYSANRENIDLVIMDMIMPRMGARECFRKFKEINPGVRVILSTGYVNNNRVQEVLNEGMIGFVQKPYQLHELSKVVVDALKLGCQAVKPIPII